MTEYTLRIHASDVDIPLLGTYRHSGYDLIVVDDSGNKKMYSIDFSTEDTENATINIKESSVYTIINNNGQMIYWDTNLSEEDIATGKPEAKDILTGTTALETFNKIKLDAALTNLVNQIDYDFLGDSRVCNTATQYWAEEYIPGYEQKDITTGLSGNFYGKDDDYVNAGGYQQAQKINFIRNIVQILDENGAINDILIDDYPYISEKYLSILEPILGEDFLANGDDIPLQELLIGIIQGIINLADLNIFNEYNKIKMTINNNISTAADTRSPLIVDLDGDGVETTTTEDGTHFDHDNNGFAEKTSWVGKDDGLLVRDLNNNGQIDDGTELFGNNSVLSSGEKAANGFEALADLDSNNDGIFDNSDTAWNQVDVWKDSNQNGKVDEGELLTLEQAGIESIDLDYQNSNTVDANGNTVGQIGTFDKPRET